MEILDEKDGESITQKFTKEETTKMIDLDALEAKEADIRERRVKEREAQVESAGELGRQQFAGVRAACVERDAELEKLRPELRRIKKIADNILEERLAKGQQKTQLEFYSLNLQPGMTEGSGYTQGLRKAVERIDMISSDNPKTWPRADFAAGALAVVGHVKKCMEGAVEIIADILTGVQATPVKSKPAPAASYPVKRTKAASRPHPHTDVPDNAEEA